MNKTQVMNIITPLVGSFATYLAASVPLLDQATWNTLISSVALAAVTLVLGYINRPLALKDTVGSMDHTTVVTDKVSAEALPNNPDVVATTPAITVAVNAAKS